MYNVQSTQYRNNKVIRSSEKTTSTKSPKHEDCAGAETQHLARPQLANMTFIVLPESLSRCACANGNNRVNPISNAVWLYLASRETFPSCNCHIFPHSCWRRHCLSETFFKQRCQCNCIYLFSGVAGPELLGKGGKKEARTSLYRQSLREHH